MEHQANPFDFASWYKLFQGHALKGHSIPLTWSFITYLNQDGIILQDNNKAFVRYKNQESSDSEDEKHWATQNTTGGAEAEEFEGVQFPELSEQIKVVIEEYKNVFPKLNSSAPVDAAWMNWSGKNKCSHPDQVFLLLKSSDIVSDLLDEVSAVDEKEMTGNSPHSLVLKKFYSLQDSSEFRCVIKNRQLKAISQRYPNKLYPHLIEEEEKIVMRIKTFFQTHVQDKFPETEYILDLYISDTDKVWIVDFNKMTEEKLGLFNKDEIDEIEDEVEYRVVEEETGIVLNDAFGARLPWDLRELSSTGEMAQFLDSLRASDNFEDKVDKLLS